MLYQKHGNFIVYKINLDSGGVQIQPDGHVKVSIPIPTNFDNSKVSVFRVEDDGSRVEYNVNVEEVDGVEYAVFETEHFSTYVLAETSNLVKDNTPKTGTKEQSNMPYVVYVMILSILGMLVLKNKEA